MTTLDKHQLKILVDTVRNPDRWLLGGVSESEAKEILKSKFNYSDQKIKSLKRGVIKK
tara:strand:- start:446 stop:619 length:174 start_codon:yes stop_codon:yes gene_type:complete